MLIEGPFETDYSLAIVNRRLALALIRAGRRVALHQRDNVTNYPPSEAFLASHPELAPHFLPSVEPSRQNIHSRYIYPPYTDHMIGGVRAVHCYGWEESVFPAEYVRAFNRDLDVITVMSGYVRDVLEQNGLRTPIEVVGLGADHLADAQAQPFPVFHGDTFHFVHISSCFPRKGADVLVRSFCGEFRRDEGVRLIIKTFHNPHNEIDSLVARASAESPDHAPIDIVWDSLSAGEMRYLIEHADCLVAPSRGEGFGLPVAEAMFFGVPVVATIHGGHADLCSPEWMWPVEFRMMPARSHLSGGQSFWAEPERDSLARRMREVYQSDVAMKRSKLARAKEHIRATFTWEQTALRHEAACLRAASVRAATCVQNLKNGGRPIHLGVITTWNARCGIAEYTRYLMESLSRNYRISVFANRILDRVRLDEPFVSRCWIADAADTPMSQLQCLADEIADAGCEAVSIQYNLGLFSPASVSGLMRLLKERNIASLVTLHASIDQRSEEVITALQVADRVMVHRRDEQEKALAGGLAHVSLQQQGIYVPKSLQRKNNPGEMEDSFVVSCFGFFLPPKGIYELLQAFETAAFTNPALRLKLLNALYDHPHSRPYASLCERFIRRHKLMDRVLVCTEFLDQDTILQELAASDLVVLPYTVSTEASSAAIRLPLASLTPVLCSDIRLFKEFEGLVHFYPAQDLIALANRILELSVDSGLLTSFSLEQRRYVDNVSWTNVARQFEAIVESCIPRRECSL